MTLQVIFTFNVTESKLTLLTTWEANESEGQGFETRNTALFEMLAEREDGRLKC